MIMIQLLPATNVPFEHFSSGSSISYGMLASTSRSQIRGVAFSSFCGGFGLVVTLDDLESCMSLREIISHVSITDEFLSTSI
mmetsp:Transcript_22234/g.62005  ORF Transcript_22234/g.62005 Transcript_22234/m.62005 type:complete len:82 (+) Transcript_22234:461-706(+)